MGLLSIIIKKLVLSGYTPVEDLIEFGVDAAVGMVRSNDENIDTQMKAAGLAEDQIKAAKDILTKSADRFILSTPADVCERNADAMIIARDITKAFIEVQGFEVYISKKKKLSLEDEDTKEQIIKGITVIVQKALNVYLKTPEYTEYLTRQHNATKSAVKEIIANIEQDRDRRFSDTESNIEAYYDYVKGLYTKRYNGNKLLGEESLSELYMQPFYYKAKEETGDVEQLLEEFCSKGESGVLWIVGEPGHGKTSMCIKAVSDYANKKHYKSVCGVFWFRLNPQGTKSLVSEQGLALESVLTWGRVEGNRKYAIDPDEIGGSLVFLDGYDELRSSLEKYNISDNEFYTQINEMAEAYCLHLVVTSRTRALEQGKLCSDTYLQDGTGQISCRFKDGSSRINKVKLLAPVTDENQLAWIDGLVKVRKEKNEDTSDLNEYRQVFLSLQKNDDVSGLLKVPILLRMIVQNCFEPSSDNRVELYGELFEMTLVRQGLDNQKETLHKVYQKLAFRIFVYDDYCAEIDKEDFAQLAGSDAYLYQYYLHAPEVESGSGTEVKYCLTFLHRSFYQYFLSEFIYELLCKVNNVESGENFLKYLWARQLDPYVLENLRNKAKGNSIEIKWILEALDRTDGILSEYVNAPDTREHIANFDKANNTFCNAVSLCNSMFQKGGNQEKFELTRRNIELLSKYNCSGMSLKESALHSACLVKADLRFADLRNANLSVALLNSANLIKVDLRNADLRSANLSSANLIFADLRNADLSNADLKNTDLTDADLRNAKLINTDLRNAKLISTKLSNADLTSAGLINTELINIDLSYAKLNYAYLNSADLSSVNLSGADLSYADLRLADLRGAVLIDTIMDNADVEDTIVLSQQYDYISRANVKNFDKIIVIDDD